MESELTTAKDLRVAESPDAAGGMLPSHPVLDLIRRRLAEQSVPRARHDAAHLALAIEGGGMRGVVSAGMVAAIEQLGILSTFDSIWGASAGSFNGAYLLSRRARVGTTIYYDDANNRGFIDLRRFRGDRPILDLGFMLDHIAEDIKPIAWDRVIDSEIPLHVVAASRTMECAVDLGTMRTKDELKAALRASATIPWIAGRPVEIAGDDFVDASVFESIPYHRAERDGGATHVLALRTRPEGVLRGKPSKVERLWIAKQLGKDVPNLVPFYLARAENYARDIAELEESTLNPTATPYRCAVVLPAREPVVSQLEKDRRALVGGAIAGFRALWKLFEAADVTVAHELRAFDF